MDQCMCFDSWHSATEKNSSLRSERRKERKGQSLCVRARLASLIAANPIGHSAQYPVLPFTLACSVILFGVQYGVRA